MKRNLMRIVALTLIKISLCVCGMVASSVPALSQEADVSKCDATLVRETSQEKDVSQKDYRLALLITKDVYQKLYQSLDAKAIVYGIPMGAGFEEYHANAVHMKSYLAESYNESRLREVAKTYLSRDGARLYGECLRAVAMSMQGLHLFIRNGSPQDRQTILAAYWYDTNKLKPITVSWEPSVVAGKTLGSKINVGENLIPLATPTTDRLKLILHYPGQDQEVTIEPIASPPPLYEGPTYVRRVLFSCAATSQDRDNAACGGPSVPTCIGPDSGNTFDSTTPAIEQYQEGAGSAKLWVAKQSANEICFYGSAVPVSPGSNNVRVNAKATVWELVPKGHDRPSVLFRESFCRGCANAEKPFPNVTGATE
jgi:hypothetical protein